MSILNVPSNTVKPPIGKPAAKFLGSNIISPKDNIKEPIDFGKIKESLEENRVKSQTLPYIISFDKDGNRIDDDSVKSQTLPSIISFDKDGNRIKSEEDEFHLL